LLVLRELMRKIEEEEDKADAAQRQTNPPAHASSTVSARGQQKKKFIPSHYFDYIAGTSAGGYDCDARVTWPR